MHSKANGATAHDRPQHRDDVRDQAVVLTFVLTLHTKHLTIPQLARALYEDRRRFKRADSVERAVRDLVGVGLVSDRRRAGEPHGSGPALHRDHRKRRLKPCDPQGCFGGRDLRRHGAVAGRLRPPRDFCGLIFCDGYPVVVAKRSKKPADLNRLAAAIVDEATDEPEDRVMSEGSAQG